ncbi:MAG: thioesterase [Deltaproteobacteria bacterium]|nr:MAG: thioesterase [Deltaproteobacteria bacterium]
MDTQVKERFIREVAGEPFAKRFGIELIDIGEGTSKVRMKATPDMNNLFGMIHGGAIFALIDEAFETASNSHGSLSVALNMNITYLNAATPGATLTAEAREINRTRKTATYDIRITDGKGALIATCTALVYRKGSPLPFLESEQEN